MTARVASDFRLIRTANVLSVHDVEHAEALLHSAGCEAEGEELRQLAREIIAGTLILARHDDGDSLDALDQLVRAPLLTLMAV